MRTDGRSIGQFVREEISGPLEVEYFFGLSDAELERLARFADTGGQDIMSVLMQMPADSTMALGSRQVRDPIDINSDAYWRAQVPASNGAGSARAMAKIYSALANEGKIDGIRLISPEQIKIMATRVTSGVEGYTQLNWTLSAGYFKHGPMMHLGGSPTAFGFVGAGGGFGFADPAYGMSVAYTCNWLYPGGGTSPRSRALIDAAYDAIRAHSVGSDDKSPTAPLESMEGQLR